MDLETYRLMGAIAFFYLPAILIFIGIVVLVFKRESDPNRYFDAAIAGAFWYLTLLGMLANVVKDRRNARRVTSDDDG